ncbi:hypothetical protein [Psychromicrobium lacuslunae]|uniref:Uncharacterized protein n=1 Tax=Psychromicrobium lacuslunae TaxID=1618207 RepID=A0A0D4C1C1_9MICC|nr:hypothetical protein [Psychromicrobium lacuslunae]AJT42190.1 hypothetical protein UM93_12995 [Psychromicrobium lacuslunae]
MNWKRITAATAIGAALVAGTALPASAATTTVRAVQNVTTYSHCMELLNNVVRTYNNGGYYTVTAAWCFGERQLNGSLLYAGKVTLQKK